jgi:hypothetical protein
MNVPTYLGRGALARFLGIGESRLQQINPEPDAIVDGRSIWLLETAARLKREREAQQRTRGAGRKRSTAEAAA